MTRKKLIRWIQNLDPTRDHNDPITQRESRVNRLTLLRRHAKLSESDEHRAWELGHKLEEGPFNAPAPPFVSQAADAFVSRCLTALSTGQLEAEGDE